MSTESEWIARVLIDNDHKAFAMILNKYQSPIRSLFRKLTSGDLALADDLSQETFLLAYKGLAQYQGGAQFLTWLYSIAKNVFYSHLRKNKNKESSADFEEESYQMTTDVRMDLENCLKILKPQERLILCLSYAEGLSHQEVADMMEMPVGTIKTIINRSKEKIQSTISLRPERSQ